MPAWLGRSRCARNNANASSARTYTPPRAETAVIGRRDNGRGRRGAYPCGLVAEDTDERVNHLAQDGAVRRDGIHDERLVRCGRLDVPEVELKGEGVL